MTIPGRAVEMVIRARFAYRSMAILGTAADANFFFTISRILMSSNKSVA